MCAICGIVNFSGEPVSQSELIAMRDVMVNRGPDFGGEWIHGNVGLGHRRLKIIDLSENANQPMPNEGKSVWVVFNGEIYNFQELREQLQGHKFQSRSDTEVIVHGYEEWGENLFGKLNGMFTIGIWDARSQKLILARDRFGKKPLFFVEQGGAVQFASDIKAFSQSGKIKLTINPQAIDCFLHHLSPTQHHCIFNEVQKIRPAHYKVFSANGAKEIRYWQPSFRGKENFSEPEVLERIDTELRDAIKRRLVSDVPLGAFLSGGIDSSLIVALMSQLSDKPAKTFSIGFEESDFSELEYSRAVAKRYKTEHQEIILKPNVLEILPSLVWEYGEPFGDSSAIPTYYVSKAAREFVTVALTGDGGDEMFGGYDIARASWYSHQLSRFLPQSIQRTLGSLGVRKLKTLSVHGSDDPAIRHSYTQGWTPSAKENLYTSQFKSLLGDHAPHHIFSEYQQSLAGLNIIDQNLLLTIVGRLPNDYLVKVDVASMKSALELRSPLLDYEISRLSESIDPMLKVKGGCQKYLLKKLSERYLPQEVIYRPKRGFALPLKHWLRKDFAPVVSNLLLDGEIVKTGWFNRDCISRTLEQHKAGADYTHRIWTLLWFELWWRMFIGKSLKASDCLKG
jgi:asparagine synthase (glutamine-hydrolysing)